MRIMKLEIRGFRSLRNVEWHPGRLNVVIGPNGSGKSNLLRALDLLAVAAKGGLGKRIQREGGMERLVWDGIDAAINVRAKFSPADDSRDEARDSLTYALILGRIGKSSSYRIDHEMLANFHRVESGERSAPFKLLERTPNNAMIFDADEKGLRANEEQLSEEETLLSVAAGPLSANRHVSDFHRDLSGWAVYEDIHTNRDAEIRQAAVTRNETRVDSDGQNLISVLHTLYTGDREFKAEVNTAMRAAFSDDFEELVFPPAADQKVQLRVRWKSLKREQSAADLSDGTLRFLFLLAVLASPKLPSLVAIDEPETGLHPSMLPIIAEYAREASRRSQIILTTHSPEFLDAFGDSPPSTTIAEWVDGESNLRMISGEELEYWLKKYTLGELFRSRQLETMS